MPAKSQERTNHFICTFILSLHLEISFIGVCVENACNMTARNKPFYLYIHFIFTFRNLFYRSLCGECLQNHRKEQAILSVHSYYLYIKKALLSESVWRMPAKSQERTSHFICTFILSLHLEIYFIGVCVEDACNITGKNKPFYLHIHYIYTFTW